MRLIFPLLCLLSWTGCKSKTEKRCLCYIQKGLEGKNAMMGGPAGQIYVNKEMKKCEQRFKTNLDEICELYKECC